MFEIVAEPFSDAGLEGFELRVLEFDHLAGPDVDEMVVMAGPFDLISRAAVAEVMALDQADIIEGAQRAVDRCHGQLRIMTARPLPQLVGVRMIAGFFQHRADHLALRRDLGARGCDAVDEAISSDWRLPLSELLTRMGSSPSGTA